MMQDNQLVEREVKQKNKVGIILNVIGLVVYLVATLIIAIDYVNVMNTTGSNASITIGFFKAIVLVITGSIINGVLMLYFIVALIVNVLRKKKGKKANVKLAIALIFLPILTEIVFIILAAS